MNKNRFEAFSDGVFAFAITLLILGITLDPLPKSPTETQLASGLLHLWPNLLAYLMSFAVIGLMWQNHHALFRLVDRIDRRTVFLNLALLCVTVFIPFATSTLGSFPTLRPAPFLYGLTLTASATVYNTLLMHLVKSKAFAAGVTAETIRPTIVAFRVGWLTYATATLVAVFWPIASFALYVFIIGYFLVPRGADTDLAAASGAADSIMEEQDLWNR